MRFFLLFCTFFLSSQAGRSYRGYKVLRTQTLNLTTARIINDIEELPRMGAKIDFWKKPSPGGQADIMSSPQNLEELSSLLSERGVNFTVMVDDVEQVIQESQTIPESRSIRQDSRYRSYAMNWNDYQDFDTINAFLDALASQQPWANVLNIGKSYENRKMNVLAVTKAGPGKPNIWLESGVHAREWIAPAVATFIARELVENYSSHPKYVDEFNWYILPSGNPDGYQYSRDHDRMWRKTRSAGVQGCKGVDMNRNFAFHYGESSSSTRQCSNSYRGPQAFSEIESKYIRDFVQWLEPKPTLATCLHSYGQVWLWPYGYARNAFPANYKEIKEMAGLATAALRKVHGTRFRPMNSAALYPAAGDSCDWYKGEVGVRFVFTAELRDSGRHGFLLPRGQIVPSGEEMWEAFKAMADKL